MNNKGYLWDVAIIRPFAILLVVLCHAFTIYGGGWRIPNGLAVEGFSLYALISAINISFMLELFVFISGYVFMYSIRKKQLDFATFLSSKLKRLIMPSVIFSVLYYFMFKYTTYESFELIRFLYDILVGVGHMWFMPMLFWVMVGAYFLEKLTISDMKKILLLLVLVIFSLIPLNLLRINTACYFILFFYIGCLVEKYKFVVSKYITVRNGVFSILMYVVTFILLEKYNREILAMHQSSILFKVIIHAIEKYCSLLCSLFAICGVYIFSNLITNRYIFGSKIIAINNLCMGIYIFHQFILQFLYYDTSIPIILGSIWLPWFGTIVTLVLSVVLSLAMRHNKYGRMLIG